MNEYKILIVDDEQDILDLLEKTLFIEGFQQIYKANNGQTAVTLCQDIKPDAIILDVMLPKMDGFDVCRKIRQFSHVPILFLSAKNEELDKILGLSVGGDDYVTKPFSPREIAFRIKAQLRRANYKQKSKSKILKIGALELDLEGCLALKNGRKLELTAREYEILQYLAQNKNRVISRESLYEAVWGQDSYGCDNIIMVHIRRLREKVEDAPNAPVYIRTVKGFGYKLVEPDES